jgi:hypothetical protein
LIPYFAAFWADTLETIEEMVDGMGQAVPTAGASKGFATHLQKRLEWLNAKLVEPAPGTGAAQPATGESLSQLDIDALLKDLA